MFYPWFFGMHLLWWLFWLALLLLIFGVATPVPRKRWREYRELNPLLLLQRRYAAGEISTAEYEERKAILQRDHAPGMLHEDPASAPISQHPREA